MEGRENESKNAKDFNGWLCEKYSDTIKRNEFLSNNYIDNKISLELSNFEMFYENRKKKLEGELLKILKITKRNNNISNVNDLAP